MTMRKGCCLPPIVIPAHLPIVTPAHLPIVIPAKAGIHTAPSDFTTQGLVA